MLSTFSSPCVGEKPYECPVCGARFSDPSSRRRHTKEHSGDKPFPCSICSDSFKRAGQLKAHIAKKHGQKDKTAEGQAAAGNPDEIQMGSALGKHGGSVVKIQGKNDNMVFHLVPLEVGDGQAGGQEGLLEQQQVYVQEVSLSESELEGVGLGRQVQLGPDGQPQPVLIDHQGQQHAVTISHEATQQAIEFSHEVPQNDITADGAAEQNLAVPPPQNPADLAPEAVLRIAAMQAEPGAQLSEVAMETEPPLPAENTTYASPMPGGQQADPKGIKYMPTLPAVDSNVNQAQALVPEVLQKETFLEETCQILEQIRSQFEGKLGSISALRLHEPERWC